MIKEANSKQIELCKQAAIARLGQYGIPAATGAQIYNAMLEKLAGLIPPAAIRPLANRAGSNLKQLSDPGFYRDMNKAYPVVGDIARGGGKRLGGVAALQLAPKFNLGARSAKDPLEPMPIRRDVPPFMR